VYFRRSLSGGDLPANLCSASAVLAESSAAARKFLPASWPPTADIATIPASWATRIGGTPIALTAVGRCFDVEVET
jgi:hypothetical protein